MAAAWALITFATAIIFLFQNGVVFALTFLGVCWIPMCAIGTAKWGLLKGDNQQKVVIPAIAVALLLFAYWLSTGVEVHVLGLTASGLIIGLISAVVGITVPLAMAEAPVAKPN